MPFSPLRLATALTVCALAGIGSAQAHSAPAGPPPGPPPGWIWQGVWQDGRWTGEWIPTAAQGPMMPPQGAYVPPMAYSPMPYSPMAYGGAGYAPMPMMAPPAPVVETRTVTTTEYIDEPRVRSRPRRAAPHRKEKRIYTGS